MQLNKSNLPTVGETDILTNSRLMEDIEYSSIGSYDLSHIDNDAISYAETADFKSCASGSGVFSAKSRVYRKTFLNGLSASIYKKLSTNDGFDEGVHEFTEKKGVIIVSFLAFIAYLLLGVFAYSYYFERWTVVDSLYFTVVTFTTCGYGDLSPISDSSRLFTLFFIILGITVLGGICLTILFENVFGAYEDMIEKAKEKTSEQFMKDSKMKADQKGGIERRNIPIQVGQNRSLPIQQGVVKSNKRRNRNLTPSSYWRAVCDLWPFILGIVAGSGFIGYMDKWDITSSAYFFVVTATSVGYGDISPESQVTRLFAVVFIPCSVMVVAELFGRLIYVYLEKRALEAEQEFLNRRMTLADFNTMDVDKNGSVTYDEFIRFFLVTMGKVKEEDMDHLKQLYEKFDANHDGTLQIDDLVLMAKGNNDADILEF